jgi:plastocyanin
MSKCLKELFATAAFLFPLLVGAPAWAAATVGDIVGVINAPVPKHKVNTVVYVKNAGQGDSSGTVKMDQRGLVFNPRVLPIQKGTTVEFLNSDTVGHNVFTPDGDKYDLGTWPQGQTRKHTFGSVGVFRQLCTVHDDMIAFIVVVDSKYFAVSDKTGAFKIPALAPGKYTLGVWHEKLAAPDLEIEVEAGKPANVTIKLDRKS